MPSSSHAAATGGDDLADGFSSLAVSDDDDFVAFKADANTIKPETVAEANQAAQEEVAVIQAVTRQASLGAADRVLVPEAVQEDSDRGEDKAKNDSSNETKDGAKPDDEDAKRDRDRRYVTPQDFELLKVIGMGAFGKVLQVRNKTSQQILAMKVISKRLIRRKVGYLETVHAERNVLMRVNHPFVVKMHCSFQTREKLFLVMDFLAGGELFLRLGREGIFLEKTAAFYIAEIILGVDHLHTRGILHRDLKPENILLGLDGHVCLTDFGLAKDFGPDWTEISNKNLNPDGTSEEDDPEHGRARTICGTQEYMAPEMVANQGYTKAADYWSLGCIAYEMLNGLPPFSSKQGSKELFRKIMSERVKMPPGSSAAACKLLKGLLNRNVSGRWGAAKSTMFQLGGVAGLKQAAFFSEVGKITDWEKLEQKQMQPPHIFPVDYDTSVQHFHEEFTNMPLPRSVMQMSKDAKMMRCDSTAFRGFSFIQQEFILPDRNEKEMQEYWNSGEDDAESLSDVASSKLGEEEPTVPEKKKRPPRKRKKKNAGMASPTPSENGGENQKETESAAALARLKEAFAKGSPPKKPQTPSSSVADASETTPVNPVAPPPRPVEQPAPKSNPASTRAAAPAPAPPPPKPASPPKWESVSTSKKNSRSNPPAEQIHAQPQKNALSANAPRYQPVQRRGQPQSQPLGGQRLVVQTQRPVGMSPPGSWASRTNKQQPQPAARSNGWGQPAQPSAALPPPASPSSDWRMHSSPRLSKAIERSQKQQQQQVPSWPTLGGSAAPKFGNAKQQQNTQRSAGNQPKGAWASRGKS